MKKQFVTYEIALKLKELGFDEECLGFWYVSQINNSCIELRHGMCIFKSTSIELSKYPKNVLAPLWQQCVDWFREKHKINIFFDCEMNISSMEVDWFKYRYKIYIDRIWSNKGCYNGSEIYEEAREQAILKCIELLKNK